MTQDRNTFRTGSARHTTEDEVWATLDRGEAAAGFQEIWEHTESELGISRVQGPEHSSSQVSGSGQNQVKPVAKYPGTEDAVLEYLDRLPKNSL